MHWILVYSQICAVITTIHFRTFPSPPKETFYSVISTAPFRPHPSPGQPRISFLFLSSCLCWTFHMTGMPCDMWPLCLAAFTEQDVSRVHPRGGLRQYSTPLYCRRVFHCILLTRVRACVSERTFGLHPLDPLLSCLACDCRSPALRHSESPLWRRRPHLSRWQVAEPSPQSSCLQMKKEERKTASTQLKSDTFFFFFLPSLFLMEQTCAL